MSDSYASRLSEYPNKGVCGLPESFDSERALTVKMKKLIQWVKEAKHTAVLSGAGISTSSGIPDFRGPNGIWTLEQEKKKVNKKRKLTKNGANNASAPKVTFDTATPTLTHRALTQMVLKNQLHFIVTQNVDGLHRRSGLSRDHHAVLHGCVFTEYCEDCRVEHFRDNEVKGMSFDKTGRSCDKCGGALRDTLLDWEDELPEFDWERAQAHCEESDIVLALGTSLRIEPAGSLPTLGKRFVIVNLQVTPYDQKADLIIRAPVDKVMTKLLEGLGHGSDWEETAEPTTIERYWKQPKPVENDDSEAKA